MTEQHAIMARAGKVYQRAPGNDNRGKVRMQVTKANRGKARMQMAINRGKARMQMTINKGKARMQMTINRGKARMQMTIPTRTTTGARPVCTRPVNKPYVYAIVTM